MFNCDIWGKVDFGQGQVTIRCTETGEHDTHKCEVFLCTEPVIPRRTTVTNDPPIEHQNIFEKLTKE